MVSPLRLSLPLLAALAAQASESQAQDAQIPPLPDAPIASSPEAATASRLLPAEMPDAAEAGNVFAALPAAQMTARPIRPDKPHPAIIVGWIGTPPGPGEEARSVTADGGAPVIIWDDLATRRMLREENGDLFETLITAGAFDPPQSSMVVALQTELTRMDCYDRGIDGVWGRNSIGGVDRYFETLGVPVLTREPAVELFRAFVHKDDVTCPAPVVASAPNRPQPAPTTRSQTTRQPQAAPKPAPSPAPKPAPKPAPEPAPEKRKFGIGVGLR